MAEDGLIRALEYKYPGAPKARADYPLMAESLTTINYFEQREKFNLLGLLMNPSFLTIIVPIGLLYILPKLSAGMGACCCGLDRSLRPLKLTLCVLCRPGGAQEGAGGNGRPEPGRSAVQHAGRRSGCRRGQ